MIEMFLANLLSPPVLFFFMGAIAVAVKSDLGIPNQISKFLSLYLLFAIGFKGGVALAESTLNLGLVSTLGSAVFLSALTPVLVFFVMKRFLTNIDSAAIAATYGSISAVTFIAASNYLTAQSVEWSGYMVAAMALMEAPAIITGLLLYASVNQDKSVFDWGKISHEAFLNGSVFLIMGSMVVGYITGTNGMDQVHVFVKDMFLGILCLFLLDMGIIAFTKFRELLQVGKSAPLGVMTAAGLIFPVLGAVTAAGLGILFQLPEGNLVLLMVLAASASYIAVPAALRLSLPEANPSIYLPMSLAITFPFNMLIGIPVYHEIAVLIVENW